MGGMFPMDYYSAIKKNEIMLFASKWMELEMIMLRKVSQVQKDTCHIFSLICKTKIERINIYKST
jgi:hypothetical protein